VHNAPLHLFSASPELVDFGGGAYQKRSEKTTALLGQLFGKLRREGFQVTYTMEDFLQDYVKEHFARLTPEEQREALKRLSSEERREVLQALPPEERLAGLSPEARLAGLSEEQVRQLLQQLAAGRPGQPRKPRRKR
jgi:hypothetical protein